MAKLPSKTQPLLDAIEDKKIAPIYLVCGELVLAEPAAQSLASALAAAAGVEVETVRRPGSLGPLLQDLRTFSLFDSGKVVLVIESALLADRNSAAELLDDTIGVLPLADAEADLTPKELAAASRLLQVLRLFSIEIGLSVEQAIAQLPEWALQGGQAFRKGRRGRGRTKKQVKEIQENLIPLLHAGVSAGLQGWAETDAADLATALKEGLPPGHHLVLAESSASTDHPLVASLASLDAAVNVGKVGMDRKGEFEGLELVSTELEKETGARIQPDALRELAKRTLRKADHRSGGGIDAESTARLAGEYRKLANLASGGTIDLELVTGSVDDRGEEDVWKLLDAVGEGKADDALTRLRRMILSSSDPLATRLSFFSLISEFCRQLVNVQAQARLLDQPLGERNYNRFKTNIAPALQGSLPDGLENPLATLHPYRLYRVYSAVSRLGTTNLSVLPARVLETELRMKGESGHPDVALAQLVAALAMGGRKSRRTSARR